MASRNRVIVDIRVERECDDGDMEASQARSELATADHASVGLAIGEALKQLHHTMVDAYLALAQATQEISTSCEDDWCSSDAKERGALIDRMNDASRILVDLASKERERLTAV